MTPTQWLGLIGVLLVLHDHSIVMAGSAIGWIASVVSLLGINWSGKLIFALAWLTFVLSIAAVALMYWLIRRSAATGFASLFYLVPAVTALFAYVLFGERLDLVSIAGMALCAAAMVQASRGAILEPAAANATASATAES